MPKLLIVVPLYKAPELIAGLLGSLIDASAEIMALDGHVILINDSPGHAPLEDELIVHFPLLAQKCSAELIANDVNMGFVGSANKGFKLALEAKADIVLLNSDTLLTPGALAEMVAVAALDPLTAVVSPRSNNATICNSPYPDRFRGMALDDAYKAHKTLASFLPRVTYVPTAVGFCLYVRLPMIQEFGLFDTIYAGGYNEENDLIMRCNQRGYRAVLANHAFVFHLGSISFSQSDVSTSERESKNRKILLDRYPEYVRAVDRYFSGIEYKTQSMAAGLLPSPSGKPRLLFDCYNIGPFHNGTFELALKTISAFVIRYADDYEFYVACNHAALVFHGLDQIAGLTFCWNAEQQMGPFAYSVRLAQPFQVDHLVGASELAPITAFLVLDTIAMDCQNLDDQNLAQVWSHMLKTTSVVGYISQFSQDQFRRRFPVPPQVTEYVALCSTSPDEYAGQGGPPPAAPDGPILLVGNHYSHKHVLDTLSLLRQHPNRPTVVVLGLDVEPEAGVVGYRAGELDQSLVDRLYDEASVVLFPSHYEGFGFPMAHALGRNKVVIARDMPVYREIIAHSPGGENVQMFTTTEQMVEAACLKPAWIEPKSKEVVPFTWADAAGKLHDALTDARARFDYDELRARLLHVEMCRSWLEAERRPLVTSSVAHEVSPQTGLATGLNSSAPPEPSQYFEGAVPDWSMAELKGLSKVPSLGGVGLAYLRLSSERSEDLPFDDSLELGHAASVGLVRVSAPDINLPTEEFVLSVLEIADLLVPGGHLHLTVPFVDGPEPLSHLRPEGARAWLESANLQVVDHKMNGDAMQFTAVKNSTWTAILPGPAEDEQFVEAAFLQAFGRSASGYGAIYALEELKAGKPRREILKHLYTSPERGAAKLGVSV